MRILIVDDDNLICENVRSKLYRIAGKECALLCDVAHSVVEAEIAMKGNVPDILITDINMPGISGLTLISHCKRQYPDVRIYVLSGYDDYQLVRQAFVNGATDYLLKPVEIRELQEKILDGKSSRSSEKAQESKAGDFQMQAAVDYVEKNLARELSMDEVAANIAMSYNYFSKRFKDYTGYSFPEYLNLRRIERSKSYLLDPSLKIADIAYKIGYRSASTFSRAFTKYEGRSPADYRHAQGMKED